MKKGDRVEFVAEVVQKNRCLAKAGDVGTVLYDQSDTIAGVTTLSVKLDRKHYPINYTPIFAIKPLVMR